VFGATRTGDVTRQRAHLVAALTAMRQEGGVVGEPDWLWAGTGLAIAEGRVEAALRLVGGAEALRQRGGARLPDHFIPPLDEVVDHAGRTIGQFIPSVDDLVDPAGRTMRPGMVARLKAEGARMTLDQLMDEAVAEPPGVDDHPLTPREREVVDLVADGLTNIEIAARLFISKRTVESHVDHIKRKLGVASRIHVMAWAVRNRNP
jgi:DNA-binding CsgD family transcriptional regulator